MGKGVQGYSSVHIGGIVTAFVCHPAVSAFVNRKGKQKGYYGKRRKYGYFRHG
jgi:amino acid permease